MLHENSVEASAFLRNNGLPARSGFKTDARCGNAHFTSLLRIHASIARR